VVKKTHVLEKRIHKRLETKYQKGTKKLGRQKKDDLSYQPPKHKHEPIEFTNEITSKVNSQYKIIKIYGPKANKAYIYTLSDLDGNIKYVGKAVDLRKRYNGHLTDYTRHFTRKTCWIVSLLKKDLVPVMDIIECCDLDNWIDREQYWIKHFQDSGMDLLNETEGGEGLNNPSQEVRDKISKANKGKVISQNQRDIMSKRMSGENHPQYGKPKSEDTRRQISETLKETNPRKDTPLTQEHKHKISDALKGNKNAVGNINTRGKTWEWSEEDKKKHSETMKKVAQKHDYASMNKDPERRKKNSEGVKKWWAERRKNKTSNQ